MLGPVPSSQVQERHGQTGVSPVKFQEVHKEVGASVISGEAEKAGTVLPGEEKAQRDLISVYEHLKAQCKEDGGVQ